MREQTKRFKRDNFKGTRGGETKPIEIVNDQNNKFSHIIPIQAIPLEVKVYNGQFDRAARTFRTLVQKERILSIFKEKQSFEKPSDRKRRKRNEARRKQAEMFVTDAYGVQTEREPRKQLRVRKMKPDTNPNQE